MSIGGYTTGADASGVVTGVVTDAVVAFVESVPYSSKATDGVSAGASGRFVVAGRYEDT